MIKWVQHQKSLKVRRGGERLVASRSNCNIGSSTLDVCIERGTGALCAGQSSHLHSYSNLAIRVHSTVLSRVHSFTPPLISKRFVFYYDLYSYLSCNICIVCVPYSYCTCIVFVSICIPQSFTASGPSI